MTTEADKLVATLLTRVKAYCHTHSLSEREFCIRVAGNHKLLTRMREGIYSARTLRRVEMALDGPPPPKRQAPATAAAVAA